MSLPSGGDEYLSAATKIYRTGALNGKPKRHRSTNAELAEIDDAIYEIGEAENPITVRGLFYRVMSRGLVPKTDKADKNTGTPNGYGIVQREVLKMRRRGDLPYGWITDGTRYQIKPRTWTNAQAALDNTAKMYRRALWAEQDVHIELWVEKAAIEGVIYPVTNEFDVPMLPARGFASETFLYETGEDLNDDGRPAFIYQLGDHDPSGVCAWEVIERRLREFVDDDIDLTFERIAVTPQQITELDLPTRPTKQSDSRAAKFDGDSVEVDAIPSPKLRSLVREAIEAHIEPEALRLTKIAERSEREILSRIAEGWADQ
jgi:hypothetical protein